MRTGYRVMLWPAGVEPGCRRGDFQGTLFYSWQKRLGLVLVDE